MDPEIDKLVEIDRNIDGRHKSFRHSCGRADNCYITQLPDWTYLDEAFPRGIIPTDISRN